jgi:hypothetical protein
VQVTEQDGQRFMLDTRGKVVPNIRGFENLATLEKNVGSTFQGAVSEQYKNDPGVALAYYGRGLVQLTWWTGYSTTGHGMGRGFDFLLNPDLLMDFDISYEVMVIGMTKGIGYANGNKLSSYFDNDVTNYTSARAIINGVERADMFAGIAKRFEVMLMDARLK